MMVWSRSRKIAGACALSILILACQSTVPPVAAPSASQAVKLGGTLTFAREEAVRTFDPHLMLGNRAEYTAAMLTYDRLVHIDASGKVVPELAESWTSTPTSVTLKLKQGPTCADGSPITTAVVVDSMKRFGAVKGLFVARTVGTAGYDVTGDESARSVTITTKAPFGDLLVGLGMPWASIVCPAGIKNPDGLLAKPAGSGPFTLTDSVAGSSHTFTARPEYNWGPNGMTTQRSGYPQQLVMKVLVNESTGASQLLRGELDVDMFQGKDRDRFKDNPDFTGVDGATYGTDYAVIKEDGIFADDQLRKALYMAIDPAQADQAMYFGYGSVNPSVVGRGVDCYDSSLAGLQPFDQAGAKKLLDSLGWVVGPNGIRVKDGKPLTLRFVGSNTFNAGPEYMAEALKAVGVDVKLAVPDFNGWVNTVLKTLDFDMSIITNSSPMPSPNASFTFISGPNTPTGQNHTHIQRPTTESAVATGRTTVGEAQCNAWKAAQRSVVENNDIKPLYSQTFRWVRKKGVSFDVIGSGVYFDPFTLKN